MLVGRDRISCGRGVPINEPVAGKESVMAVVTLLQSTDMSALPPNIGAPQTFSDSEPELWARWFGVASVSCVGSVSADTRTVQQVGIDDLDFGIGVNIEILGLTFTRPKAYFVDVVLAGNFQQFATDLLAGSDAIAGSAGRDVILSFDGNDRVNAGAGNDDLYGGRGRDLLNGGLGDDFFDGDRGNDTLIGGLGRDTLVGSNERDLLIGGAGADDLNPFVLHDNGQNDGARDILRFALLSDSGPTAATRDVIFGFIRGAGITADRIDLSPIDADPTKPGNQAFHLVNVFTAAHGEVRLVRSGSDTLVQVDGDNDPAIDMTILVHTTGLHAIDFIL
jgi:Ca2+-binding RTX toxin-like protein